MKIYLQLAGNKEYIKKLDFFTNKNLKINESLLKNDSVWNKKSIDDRTEWFKNKTVMIFPFNKSSNKYGQKKEIFANLKGMTIEATYNEHTKIVTIKKGVPVYDYSDDRENDNFQLFTDLCSNGTIQLGDDKQYYFAEEYSFEPKKFGKNDTAKSASINFITNGSYSGPKSWKDKK